ncbi:synaptonemal complex protein 2 [Notechis scutatus]|uniref:Synaptonemal complex protein 2 n=1 Tax=Notechis scutatus TaxID=8663 RepID=A0A6J1TZ77_9SAUR|nr:synaptonemal complex protein 2 [Notechis scutatus]
MLTAMPRDIRKKTISTKEMLQVMNDMGKRILDAGDYDLQVAITEALCRMTSEKQRRELAIQWFPMDFVSSAFKQIKDSEFETDCRKFLNQVNAMLGDKRRVFTYPCLSAALGKHELQMPADENLEECWIDFNVGSKSISFYVAADDEGQQWETVCIPEEDVRTYIIEEKEKEKLLMVHLNNPMSVGAQEGEKIILHFDSALEIMDAVRKVYEATKCQVFTRKNTVSVAKTTVHVVFDESGSQTTPGKRKMSEASMIVSSTSRFSVQSPFPIINTSTPRKGKITPLQMMSLVERNEDFSVPETRVMKTGREDNCAPLFSATKALNRNNSVEKKMKNIIYSEEDLDINGKQSLAANRSDRAAKQRAFASIFEMSCSELRNKQHCRGKIIEEQHSKTNNIPDSQTCFKHLDEKIPKSKSRKSVSNTSKISLPATKKNNGSLTTSRHSKSISEMNDHDIRLNISPSAKETANKKTDQKTKSKDVIEAAEMLISKISKRYKEKDGIKNTSKVCQSFSDRSDDVYDFNRSGFDEPTIKLGGRKNRNYKHLFSDTDTEYRGDDTNTEISWLRESNRKPKPQLVNYGRARKPRKFKTLEPVPISKNQNDNGDGERTLLTRSTKLRKAALAKKCYKELSSSGIESEEEISEYLHKKNTSNEHPEHKITAKSRAVNQPKIQQHTIASEAVRGKLINQPQRSTKAKDDMTKNQMELPSSLSSGSPPFSEIMRCYEKHTEESTEEHISVRRSSLSSYLEELTPEKEKSLENIKEDFIMGKINSESELLKDLPEKGRKLVFETEDLSPVISPLSLSNNSPFNRKKPFINYKNSEIAEDEICYADEAVSITRGLLNKSFRTEMEDTSENIMKSRREGSLSPSQLTTPCRSREELQHEECFTDVHESVSENLSTFSINETSPFDGEGCSNVETICQTLHKEFARKIQSRSKKIDCFAKQSLKTTHQHMNTMGRELQKYRSRQLENLHSCLLKELESFERDSQLLRNIEKDFSNFSKKHFETFSTYNKNEQQRLQNLRTSFEKNIYHTADQEENIFLSQVHFLKEDFNGIQDKFLKEMHEEELLNVRKGLQSLFMGEDRKL